MLIALCGAETGSGMGLLESCTVLYPEELVLAADIYHRVRITAGRLDTSRAAMALDVIKEIGRVGQYLRHRHTRDYLRRLRSSELVAQRDPSGGFRDPIQLAREKVDWILQNHHPRPSRGITNKEFKRILETAEKNFGHLINNLFYKGKEETMNTRFFKWAVGITLITVVAMSLPACSALPQSATGSQIVIVIAEDPPSFNAT